MTIPARDDDARALLAADPGLRRLTNAHRDALRIYSGNHFYLIQQRLWGTAEAMEFGSVERRFVDEVVGAMDEAFSLLDGPSADVVLYRGGPAPPSEGHMRGYVSTSLSRANAEAIATPTGDLWTITVPAGSPVLLLPAIDATADPDQQEVLIARNQRFILNQVTPRGAHGRSLSAELQR